MQLHSRNNIHIAVSSEWKIQYIRPQLGNFYN